MKCLAVDDEPLALSIIEKFCSQIPTIELVATAPDGVIAFEILKNEQIDLMFIDINMPHMTGIETVKMLDNPPLIIFTTAYQNYALTGFELSAIDYLVKPFSFDRFFKAVKKAEKQCELLRAAATDANKDDIEDQTTDYMMVKCDYSVVKVNFESINFIEGLKDYVKIHTTDRNIVTKSTMKNIEGHLSLKNFMRVHKSFIINTNSIDSFENNHIIIGADKIPLGLQYKDAFGVYINKNKL